MKIHSSARAAGIGFILTLLACSFLLLAGIALQNTATAIFGAEQTALTITSSEVIPQLNISILATEYRVDLSGLNQATAMAEENYPLLPRSVRLVQYIFAALEEGLSALFG